MPLTPYQLALARLLAINRSPDSHLAGGAALHFEPTSTRYSNDLDYFHDSVERVATAFDADRTILEQHGHSISLDISQPGYVRATVAKDGERTKIEWAHDSAWRFMPAQAHPDSGYRLHPLDLAINKVLALAGRNEARDLLDVLTVHRDVLPLGALCWAAAGKDPGFTPLSLLELLKRRGRFQPADFARLRLVAPVDLADLKTRWTAAIEQADTCVAEGDPREIGCVYYDRERSSFVAPTAAERREAHIVPHYGRPGGVLPEVLTE